MFAYNQGISIGTNLHRPVIFLFKRHAVSRIHRGCSLWFFSLQIFPIFPDFVHSKRFISLPSPLFLYFTCFNKGKKFVADQNTSCIIFYVARSKFSSSCLPKQVSWTRWSTWVENFFYFLWFFLSRRFVCLACSFSSFLFSFLVTFIRRKKFAIGQNTSCIIFYVARPKLSSFCSPSFHLLLCVGRGKMAPRSV